MAARKRQRKPRLNCTDQPALNHDRRLQYKDELTIMAYMTKMTRRKAELLAEIEKSPPLSIYQLATQCERNYRRVFDHVKELASADLVNIRPAIRNGRKVSMVESIYHQRLQHLDDMYAFKAEINAAQ